jgi:hypothetical protein
VAFCVALKWQPWAARLHLPLFALGIVAVVGAADAGGRRWRRASAVGALALAAAAWLPGADTAGRTLWTAPTLLALSREENYYRMLPRLRARDDALAEVVARSGARAVSIQSVHDIPYPLMRRLRREIADLRWSGAPATDRRVDAIIPLALGSPLPLTCDGEDRRDWRLVGAGFGDGCYLPEAQVRALGWWDELPAFAGWVRQTGLPLADWRFAAEGLVVVREIPEGRGQLVYQAAGRPLRLRAALRRVDALESDLQITCAVGNREFAAVDCGRSAGREFEIQLPSSLGPHVIELRVPARMAREVVFTRLQINDSP